MLWIIFIASNLLLAFGDYQSLFVIPLIFVFIQGKLYLLVTDQGYLNQSKIIWETLADVDGESQFVNEAFGIVGPLTTPESYRSHQPQKQNELSQEDRE